MPLLDRHGRWRAIVMTTGGMPWSCAGVGPRWQLTQVAGPGRRRERFLSARALELDEPQARLELEALYAAADFPA